MGTAIRPIGSMDTPWGPRARPPMEIIKCTIPSNEPVPAYPLGPLMAEEEEEEEDTLLHNRRRRHIRRQDFPILLCPPRPCPKSIIPTIFRSKLSATTDTTILGSNQQDPKATAAARSEPRRPSPGRTSSPR